MSLIILAALLALGVPSAAYASPPTLAIMKFDNRKAGDWDWLCNGLTDMLITDLSAARQMQVVERQKIGPILAEIKLVQTGLVTPSLATEFGKVAKVDKVLFGSFLKDGERLEIEIHLVDVDTGKLLWVESVSGAPGQLFVMEKELALRIIKNLLVPISSAEADLIKFKHTDSIPAAEKYSGALEAYDHGDYPKALACFREAGRKDPAFDKAYYGAAEIYRMMGEEKHAVLAYESILRFPSFPAYRAKALLRLAVIYESRLKDYARAISAYRALASMDIWDVSGLLSRDENPGRWDNSLVDWTTFKISKILEMQGQYGTAMSNYCMLLAQHWEKKHPEYKDLPWLWSLCLHPCMVPVQGRMWICVKKSLDTDDRLLNPQNRIITLSPSNSVYREDYSTLKRVRDAQWDMSVDPKKFLDKTCETYKQGIYIFAAADGYYVDSVHLQVRGKAGPGSHVMAKVADFAVFDDENGMGFPSQIKYGGIDLTGNDVTSNLDVHFPGNTHTRIFLVVPWVGRESDGNRLESWSLDADLVRYDPKEPRKPDLQFRLAQPVQQVQHLGKWDLIGQVDFQLLHPDRFLGVGLLMDAHGHAWLVWNLNRDLWISDSADGINWREPELLPAPINTTDDEGAFDLIKDNSGNYELAWFSTRTGKTRLYVAKSKDMKSWSYPIVVDSANETWIYSAPALVQNQDGPFTVFWHAYFDGDKESLVSAQSPDCDQWSSPALVNRKMIYGNRVTAAADGAGQCVIDQVFTRRKGWSHGEHWMTICRSSDGVKWTDPLDLPDPLSYPTDLTTIDRDDYSCAPLALMRNHRSSFVLLWRTRNTVFIGESHDMLSWRAKANVPFYGNWAALAQDHDGGYWLAMLQCNKIIIARSKDPFGSGQAGN